MHPALMITRQTVDIRENSMYLCVADAVRKQPVYGEVAKTNYLLSRYSTASFGGIFRGL